MTSLNGRWRGLNVSPVAAVCRGGNRRGLRRRRSGRGGGCGVRCGRGGRRRHRRRVRLVVRADGEQYRGGGQKSEGGEERSPRHGSPSAGGDHCGVRPSRPVPARDEPAGLAQTERSCGCPSRCPARRTTSRPPGSRASSARWRTPASPSWRQGARRRGHTSPRRARARTNPPPKRPPTAPTRPCADPASGRTHSCRVGLQGRFITSLRLLPAWVRASHGGPARTTVRLCSQGH